MVSRPASVRQTTPPLWALHILFLMTGTGTTFLGPILPMLSQTWHLHDAQAGVLLACQFLGAFVGGISVGSHAASMGERIAPMLQEKFSRVSVRARWSSGNWPPMMLFAVTM